MCKAYLTKSQTCFILQKVKLALHAEKETIMKKLNMGAALAIGVGLGTAIGVALDNLALGIGIGVAIGTAFGAAAASNQKPDDK